MVNSLSNFFETFFWGNPAQTTSPSSFVADSRNPVVHQAASSVGTVFTPGGSRICSALLVGCDRVLLPAHGVENDNWKELSIAFIGEDPTRAISFRRTFQPLQLVWIDQYDDYCLLQLQCDTDGTLPGDLFPIASIVDAPGDGDFFFFHADDQGNSLVSTSRARCLSFGETGFCSLQETHPGSSGGILFDSSGNAFAMHLGRSTGLCGRSGEERKSLLLSHIYENNQILREIPPNQPLFCSLVPAESCVPEMDLNDLCIELERHGELQSREVRNEPSRRPINRSIANQAIEFLNEILNMDGKQGFYSKICQKNTGTVYRKKDANLRLDIQKPEGGHQNIQIQIGDSTIAGFLLSNELTQYADDPHRMAMVVNYIVYKWIGVINYAQTQHREVILEISRRQTAS